MRRQRTERESQRSKAQRFVVIAGPAPEAKGGIASVLAVLSRAGLFRRPGVRFLTTYRDGGRLAKALVALGAVLRLLYWGVCGRIIALHVHSAYDASFIRKGVLTLLTKAMRRPVIFQIHSGALHKRYVQSEGPWRWFMKTVLLAADRLLVLTPEQLAFFRRDLGHRSVHLVPNPVELPATSEVMPSVGKEIAYFGAIEKDKGVFDLLQAWRHVALTFPDASLRMYGEGDIETCYRIASEYGIKASVTFSGWVEGPEKQLCLQRAMLVVLPSYSEALPMTLLEAMAFQKPFVATNVGAIPLLADDGRIGWLVVPGDPNGLARAIEECLEDPRASQERGNEGYRKIVAEFSAERVLGALTEIYDECGHLTD